MNYPTDRVTKKSHPVANMLRISEQLSGRNHTDNFELVELLSKINSASPAWEIITFDAVWLCD